MITYSIRIYTRIDWRLLTAATDYTLLLLYKNYMYKHIKTGYGIIQNLGSSVVKPRCSVLFPKITLTRLIRSNHLRDLHGLVLAGRYFWVQNLGSSNIVHLFG